MKEKVLTIIFILISTISYCQQQDCKFEKAKYNGDLRKYVATRLKYPISMQQNQIDGDVIVTFKIDAKGGMDSISVIQTPDRTLSNPVVKVLAETAESWEPTKKDEIPVAQRYYFVVEYRLENISTDRSLALYTQAKKLYEKQKNEKALIKIDKAIASKPYMVKYYKLRSKILKNAGNDDLANTDLIKCNEIAQSYFQPITIKGYSITTKKVIGSSVTSTQRRVNL